MKRRLHIPSPSGSAVPRDTGFQPLDHGLFLSVLIPHSCAGRAPEGYGAPLTCFWVPPIDGVDLHRRSLVGEDADEEVAVSILSDGDGRLGLDDGVDSSDWARRAVSEASRPGAET